MGTRPRRHHVRIGLALTALGFVTACGSTSGSAADSKPTIGFVNGNTIEFHTCLEKAVRATAEEKGANLVVANSTGDPTKELGNIEDMIVRNVSAIVLQTVNVDAQLSGVAKARAAGIPIFLTSVAAADKGAILGAVTTDLKAIGGEVGKWVATDSSGPATAAIIGGAPGSASDPLTAGFKAAVGGDVRVVFEQPAFWQRAKAQDVAENLLQSHPEVRYVFVHNEDMAFGTLAALKAAKRTDIKIVTNNGSEAGITAIRSGEFAMTVSNSPDEVGRMAVEGVLEQLAARNDTTKVQRVRQIVITKANADQAPRYCR